MTGPKNFFVFLRRSKNSPSKLTFPSYIYCFWSFFIILSFFFWLILFYFLASFDKSLASFSAIFHTNCHFLLLWATFRLLFWPFLPFSTIYHYLDIFLFLHYLITARLAIFISFSKWCTQVDLKNLNFWNKNSRKQRNVGRLLFSNTKVTATTVEEKKSSNCFTPHCSRPFNFVKWHA